MQKFVHRRLKYGIIGTQERVLVRQGKRTTRVRAIEVLLYSVFWRHCYQSSLSIGVGRFRILGGGANSQQAHDVEMTSMRRNDVASTSLRRHVPTRFLINQCQIITILILKSDIIENSRIELREIVLPVPSNQIKVTFI